jgi:hypothetical protein
MAGKMMTIGMVDKFDKFRNLLYNLSLVIHLMDLTKLA